MFKLFNHRSIQGDCQVRLGRGIERSYVILVQTESPNQLSLFLLSAVLRVAAHVLLSYRFNEVRHILRKYSGIRLFFSVAKIRPIVGLSRGWNAMIMLKDFFEKEDGKIETKQN